MKTVSVRLCSNSVKKAYAIHVTCIREFYKYIEDLELCGVGLSCEASVELLTEDMQSNQVIFTIEDDNGEFSPDERLTIQNIFELLAFDIRSSTISIYSIP